MRSRNVENIIGQSPSPTHTFYLLKSVVARHKPATRSGQLAKISWRPTTIKTQEDPVRLSDSDSPGSRS
ncbi:hypothetical protein VTN00DRAFT_4292 [Thermoascus crustaceus]|uniref:uncharacterized protein n=1 Tax=Thermoascus crustaceus TaxID=5088 RepID=UPI0037429764